MRRKGNYEDARILLTRRCNYSCINCRIHGAGFKELSVPQWKKVLGNLGALGVGSLRILGGEPTLYDGFPELLRFICEKTKIRCLVESNSSFGKDVLQALLSAGLSAYCTDVSTLRGRPLLGRPNIGLDMLERLRAEGVRHLEANIILHRKNMDEVQDIITRLSGMGVMTNILPLNYGSAYKHWILRPRNVPQSHKFAVRDVGSLEKLVEDVVRLKQKTGLVKNSVEYLEGIPRHVINFDWHCSKRRQLRLDCDGSFMVCCDIAGEVRKYNGLSITPKLFKSFERDWLQSKERVGCPGCYYSSYFP